MLCKILSKANLCLVIFIMTLTVSFGQGKPNVILIMTDDQGTIDLNSFGADDLYTPNLDALAESGVKFTQFYAGAPICSPSRAALLTGLNPHAAGLPANTSSIPGGKGMPTEQITIAETMKGAGYATGHVGKWHLGFSPETMPLGQGFDYSFGHMGGCIDNYSHFFYWNGPNRHDLYENGKEVFYDGEYFQDLMADKADSFIEANRTQAFFLYYAINLPHYPLQADNKWREHYKDLSHPRKDYAACISTIDENIGQLVKTLERENLLENTIIIFQSDHGHSVEERAFYGGGSAGIYRGAKTSLFEGGIRVPAILSWKNNIAPSQVRDQVAVSMDWFATIADYCEIETHGIEGKSLRLIVENENALTEHEMIRWKQGVRWAIRKGPWKLLGLPNDPENKGSIDPNQDLLFLSNLDHDPTERKNFAREHPEKLEELKQDYLKWEYADEDDIPAKSKNIVSLAKGKKIQLIYPPSQKYNVGGANALIDEFCGSRYFNDGRWLGFESNDCIATIDLGEKQNMHSLKIGLLQDASSWILLPSAITYSFSDNNVDYHDHGRLELDEIKDMNSKKLVRVTIDLEKIKSRYVKIHLNNITSLPEWHSNKGGKAWLFVDELTIQ